MSELEYPFGFLIGYALEKGPDHFLRREFPAPLFTHPETPLVISRSEDNNVALIGEPVDPDLPMRSVADIADDLATHSSDAQDLIDRLVGRFAMIQGDLAGGFHIQTDAIGMRSVYFENTQPSTIAGSHAALVADATGAPDARRERLRFSLGYPGMATPWSTVDRLPPNQKLSLQAGTLTRLFPTRALPPNTVEDAWLGALDAAGRAAEGLAARHPLLMSLTAGLDSRATLAAVRPLWPQMTFFTYTNGNPKHDLDVDVATDIARRLKLRHEILDYSDIETDPTVMQAIRGNTFGSHQHRLSMAYRESFGPKRALHVRTNLLEITRSNLFAMGERHIPGGPDTAEKMAAYYARSGKLDENPAYLAAFTDFHDRTGGRDIPDNVSRWDLFFIEHRMGAWHAGILEESDIAFDTTILFNSRRIITSFMAAPERDRRASQTLHQLIAERLPEIVDIPVNRRN